MIKVDLFQPHWAGVVREGEYVRVRKAVPLTVGGKVWGRVLHIIGHATEVSRRTVADGNYMGMAYEETIHLLPEGDSSGLVGAAA